MPYVPNNDETRRRMLAAIGIDDMEELFAPVPEKVRGGEFKLPVGLPEINVQQRLEALAEKNTGARAKCFAGAGSYDHWIPPVVTEIISRSEFLTAYTPYQPEMSQGALQAIFEFQTSIAGLCGLEVANSSLYDGATAALEAVAMACRATRKRKRIVVDNSVHPAYRATVATGAKARGLEVVEVGNLAGGSGDGLPSAVPVQELSAAIDENTACVLSAAPAFSGAVRDLSPLAEAAHEKGALLVISINPVAAAVFKSPGEMGADIACGEGQPLGLPLSFGGPYLGFLAARKKYVRRMPGRIVGETVDAKGSRAFTLTLQAREQHIRREKATSNICSNQALCALAAGIYLSALGPEGLKTVAETCIAGANSLRKKLAAMDGVEVSGEIIFNEFLYRTPLPAVEVIEKMFEHGILAGVAVKEKFSDIKEVSASDVLVAVTEKRTAAELDEYVEVLKSILPAG